MESKDNVEPAAARLSASPRGPVEEAEGLQSATTGTPINIRSSPPALEFDNASNAGLRAGGSPEDVGVKSDSEAETIVLPGKDGHSPSKIRKTKSIKHEDKSEDEQLRNGSDIESRNGGRSGSGSAKSQLRRDDQASELATSTLGKRKRSKHGHSHIHADDPAYTGNSSGLSSVPTSPVATTRSSLSKPAASDSDVSNPPSPRITSREAKSVDRVLSRRKQSNEDEIQSRKFSRQQSSGGDHKQTREKRTSSVSHDIASHQRTRSISPPSRIHKRSISTQLPAGAANGLGHKKKRVPAPLQSTEYQSDASSVSEGDHPRGSRVRHLAAPATGDSAISPAKMPSHKKSGRDHHGLTLLARACSSGNLEQARIRLEERPDDLDLPDNSGNTPLQHASLKGHDNIVKFLLDAGCLVDSINVAKDTPLIDAVDNGHLAVVKLLLDAGANPRQPNVHGAEPISRVDPDDDDADEMKAAIAAAIETYKPPKDQEGRLSHPTDSPRQTPPIATPHQPGFAVSSRRGAGGRSVKTSNELLYKSSDVHELRRAAGEGETENVGRILELKHGQNSWNDAETLVIAAKAGHIEILNLLLAYNFDPDPDPLVSMERTEPQFATPMLAAIGRNSERYLPVIELFVEQSGFNPTRKLKGETYSDIAKRRAGTFWEREKQILDEAAEKYKKTHKYSPVQPRSPGLRRDAHRESKRSRDEPEQPSRPHKRRLSSPKAKDTEPKKRESSTSGQVETKRGHQRSNSSTSQPKDGQAKRGPGRPRKDERTPSAIVSDRETTPLGPPKPKSQPRRSESDLATASDTEAVKPRRKLVSGKDLKGEREREKEKQRRASVVSTASSASAKERHGPSESKSGTLNSKGPRLSTSDLEHDRARSLKRDDSKDRLSAIRGESPAKRQRTSVTPPRVQSSDAGEGTVKRRKLDPDSKERRKADSNFSSSPDHHNRDRTSTGKSGLSRERTSDAKDRDRKSEDTGKSHSHKTAKRSSTSSSEAKENSKSSKDEDVVMEDRDQVKAKADKERETRIRREKEKEKDREAKEKEAKEKEAREKEAREKEAKEKEAKEQEAKEQEAKEKAAKEKEEAEKKAEEAKQKEEAAKREEEYREQLKQARIAREKLAEEAEVKRLEEEARQREIQRQADADALHRAQAEKQRLYQEQQEKAKEEQELARKKREEERQKMAQLREKERLEKLPFLLRWFDQTLQPINAEITNLFRHMEGFRADTINGELAGQPAGRDQWLLNTHVALLLGEKDLSLSRYTSWEHIDLTPDMKKAIYLYEGTKYSLTHSELKGIRTALLGNEYGTSYEGKQPIWKLSDIARPLFIEMPMFFVKLSEFMYIVPRFPHLRGVEMVVHYRELIGFPAPLQPETPKYEQDPDHDPRQKWMPLPKYYKDGNFVRQGVPKRARLMTSQEVLRRDQERQQIASYQFPSPTTNNYRSISSGSPTKDPQTNGMTPPKSDKSVNGGSPHQGPIPNGVSASPTSETVDVVMESL